MTTEEVLNHVITDKLIEVAKNPEMRKEFSIIYENTKICCYKRHPMMCDVDRYISATYYSGGIIREKLVEKCQEYYDKSLGYIKEMTDEMDAYEALAYLDALMVHHYENKKDYSKAKKYMLERLSSLVNTASGVTIEDFRRLKNISKSDATNPDFYDSLLEVENYFKDFDRNLEKEKGRENIWPEYAQKAIADIKEMTMSLCNDETGAGESETDWFATSILQAYGIIAPPKRRSPRKGEFEYNYNKAEKGDVESQRIVAYCYREGRQVSKNERLAKFWQTLADENRYIE